MHYQLLNAVLMAQLIGKLGWIQMKVHRLGGINVLEKEKLRFIGSKSFANCFLAPGNCGLGMGKHLCLFLPA